MSRPPCEEELWREAGQAADHVMRRLHNEEWAALRRAAYEALRPCATPALPTEQEDRSP